MRAAPFFFRKRAYYEMIFFVTEAGVNSSAIAVLMPGYWPSSSYV